MSKQNLKIKVYTFHGTIPTEFLFNKNFELIEEVGEDLYDYPLGTQFAEIEQDIRQEVIRAISAKYEVAIG